MAEKYIIVYLQFLIVQMEKDIITQMIGINALKDVVHLIPIQQIIFVTKKQIVTISKQLVELIKDVLPHVMLEKVL